MVDSSLKKAPKKRAKRLKPKPLTDQQEQALKQWGVELGQLWKTPKRK